MFTAAVTGYASAFSLILAIGAQNAFVLRQGLMRAHVFWVCLVCALSDAILITAGVMGFGVIVTAFPALPMIMALSGAAFLFVYGAMRFRSAFSGEAMDISKQAALPLRRTLLTALAFTWLNPHVYLDTLALLGAISTAFEGAQKVAFGAAAVLSSFTFFFGLGYGARLLAPLLSTPRAWRILDLGIGALMWLLALWLVMGAVNH